MLLYQISPVYLQSMHLSMYTKAFEKSEYQQIVLKNHLRAPNKLSYFLARIILYHEYVYVYKIRIKKKKRRLSLVFLYIKICSLIILILVGSSKTAVDVNNAIHRSNRLFRSTGVHRALSYHLI